MLDSMMLEEWKRQARDAKLSKEYDYHLAMFEQPLSFGAWRVKFKVLTAIQNRPEYLSGEPLPLGLEELAERLCLELGF